MRHIPEAKHRKDDTIPYYIYSIKDLKQRKGGHYERKDSVNSL